MDRLSKGEQVLGVSAVLLFILSFIKPWAKIDFGDLGDLGGLGGGANANAWDAYNFFPLKFGLLLALIAIVLVGLRAAGVNMNMPVQWGVLYLVLGGLTLLMVLLALLTGPAGSGFEFAGAGIKRGFMLYVGLILAAGMAVGGYLHWQEEGGTTTMGGTTTPPAGGPPPPPAT